MAGNGRKHFPTIDTSKENFECADRLGFYVEDRGNGAVFYLTHGGRRKAFPAEMCMWQEIVDLSRKVKYLSAELATQAKSSVEAERSRIIKCINRASRELSVHQETLTLCSEFVKSDDAEGEIFGATEI